MATQTKKQNAWSRLVDRFVGEENETYAMDIPQPSVPATATRRDTAHYHISVRRQVEHWDDVAFLADGLLNGTQQILNLSNCQPQLREKIKDFLAGVNYAVKGEWVELGENIYLLAPETAYVDEMPIGSKAKLN